MRQTFDKLTVLADKLKNSFPLTPAALEEAFADFQIIVQEVSSFDTLMVHYEEFTVDLPGISKNLKRMYGSVSLLKKDVAFLLARNAINNNIIALMQIIKSHNETRIVPLDHLQPRLSLQ